MPLTLDVIKNSQWTFSNPDGKLGTMTFNSNGTVGTYNNSNEKYWSFNGNLHLINKNNKKTCTFNIKQKVNGKWIL